MIHDSVKRALSMAALTNRETQSIVEAVELLKSRLDVLPWLSHLEVALVPSDEARELGATSQDSGEWRSILGLERSAHY